MKIETGPKVATMSLKIIHLPINLKDILIDQSFGDFKKEKQSVAE
jgi:hypothetical protein